MNVNCFVSKLKGVVNNDSLPLLDAFQIFFDEIASPNNYSQGFKMACKSSQSAIINTKNGHFTSADLTSDLGTEMTIDNTTRNFYVSNGATLIVNSKHCLDKLIMRIGTVQQSNVSHIRFNIEDLAGTQVSLLQIDNTSAYGSIAKAMADNDSIQYCEFEGTNISGDISAFDTKNTLIRLRAQHSNVTGDITGVLALPLLEELTVKDCSGDLTNAASNSLKTFVSRDCSFIGDVSFFSNFTALITVQMYHAPLITGNIENIVLPTTCKNFTFRSNTNVTGSIATFRANNPNCTTVDFAGCTHVTA